jgi:RHS repeat-associated protein
VTRARAYSEAYVYDALGNLLQLRHQAGALAITRTATLAAGNRLASVQIGALSYSYAYDANGNLILENTERHFDWDHFDRLGAYRTQVRAAGSLPSEDRWAEPTVFAHYLYDSNGERVKKLVRKQGGRVEVTVYIDGVFEHQHIVAGGVTEENDTLHVMDQARRVASVRLGPRIGGDTIVSPVKYYLADHLGNTSVRVDGAGAFIDREEYTPYGESSFGIVARKRYRFGGKERDSESGLYYHGARYYAPWLARWTSCDPAGSVDGLNLYSYTASNPVTFKDSTGTQLETPLPEEEAAQQSLPELHQPAEATDDPDNMVSRAAGGAGYGLSYASPPGYTLRVPDTYSGDKMSAYQRGVLEGEIGRNAGSGSNSTTLRRNTPAQRGARAQHQAAVPRPTTTAPGGQGWAQDHIIELQHDLTGRRGTAPTDYRWQDSRANSTEGGRSWALNRNNPQGVPAGGVCRAADAGKWYNTEGARSVGRGAGRVLLVYGIYQSGSHIESAIEADIEQGTAGAQTARAVATEAGGWAGALAVAPEAAAAGVVCGPGAWVCVPVFGLVGGGVGYFAGSSVVEGVIDFGNWVLE